MLVSDTLGFIEQIHWQGRLPDVIAEMQERQAMYSETHTNIRLVFTIGGNLRHQYAIIAVVGDREETEAEKEFRLKYPLK